MPIIPRHRCHPGISLIITLLQKHTVRYRKAYFAKRHIENWFRFRKKIRSVKMLSFCNIWLRLFAIYDVSETRYKTLRPSSKRSVFKITCEMRTANMCHLANYIETRWPLESLNRNSAKFTKPLREILQFSAIQFPDVRASEIFSSGSWVTTGKKI